MSSFAPFRRALSRAAPSSSTVAAARPFSSTRAAQLSRLNVIGRLGAAPEAITTNSGRELVRYSVGTSSGPPDNRVTSWWNIATFLEGERRDHILSLPKGSLVYVETEARMRKVEKQGGQMDNVLSLTQLRIEVLKKPTSAKEAQAKSDEPAEASSESASTDADEPATR